MWQYNYTNYNYDELYHTKHNTTLNCKPIRINSEQIRKASELGKKIFSFGKYVY